jgi:hypothetical protein
MGVKISLYPTTSKAGCPTFSRTVRKGGRRECPHPENHPKTVIPSAVAGSRSESTTESREPASARSTKNPSRHFHHVHRRAITQTPIRARESSRSGGNPARLRRQSRSPAPAHQGRSRRHHLPRPTLQQPPPGYTCSSPGAGAPPLEGFWHGAGNIAHKAAALGFDVAKPHGDNERYDFVGDSGVRFWRVQVKTICQVHGHLYQTSVSHGHGVNTKPYKCQRN